MVDIETSKDELIKQVYSNIESDKKKQLAAVDRLSTPKEMGKKKMKKPKDKKVYTEAEIAELRAKASKKEKYDAVAMYPDAKHVEIKKPLWDEDLSKIGANPEQIRNRLLGFESHLSHPPVGHYGKDDNYMREQVTKYFHEYFYKFDRFDKNLVKSVDNRLEAALSLPEDDRNKIVRGLASELKLELVKKYKPEMRR